MISIYRMRPRNRSATKNKSFLKIRAGGPVGPVTCKVLKSLDGPVQRPGRPGYL